MKKLKKLLFGAAFFTALGLSQAEAKNISLGWDENQEQDLAGYELFHREKNQSYNFNSPSYQGMENTCTISELDDTKTYCFVVRAFNDSGNRSGVSNEVCIDNKLNANLVLPSQTYSWEFEDGDGFFENISQGERDFAYIYSYAPTPLVRIPINSRLREAEEKTLLFISAQNLNLQPQNLEVILEDWEGFRGSYVSQNSGTIDNLYPGENLLALRVDSPFSHETGFNQRHIKDILISGPSNYNLEEIIMVPGGRQISGNLIPGINTSNVYNYADFHQENLLNMPSGRVSMATTYNLTYMTCSAQSLDLNLQDKSDALFLFLLSQNQYDKFPLTAMDLIIGGQTHRIRKSELKVGPNKITKPVNSSQYTNNASIRIYHTTRFSTSQEFQKMEGLYIGIRD